MDPRFQTSFIPKKPMIAAQGIKVTPPISIFSLIAGIFFVGALIMSGGVFFYKQLTVKQIETGKQALEDAKAAYDPESVNYLIRLDSRLAASKVLLDRHVAVTPLFDFIGTLTLKSVRFRDFTFTYLAADKIQVEMKGQAQNYASVALQSDLFTDQKNLRNTVISDMVLEANGSVSFKVSTIVDPTLTSYTAFIKGTAPVEVIEQTNE